MFDWFFEAACPASLQEGELGASGGGGETEGGPGALNVKACSPCRPPHPAAVPPRLQGPGTQAGSLIPLGEGPPWLGQGGAKQCVLLSTQDAMQMVPKFCFPFDVERYGRKQTPKDPGTQTSQGAPGSNTQGP